MPLTTGSRVGTYEILGPLGAGGMGEVYRARDTKLGRSVAIKVLPAAFADDPERLARFEREARSLAALNHPHIATLYGLEASDHEDHRSLLVMELVEGETLAERLAQGPLPLDVALRIAQQIADALEAAHEKGIIHRDVKPANIKITPDEQVKVLDFGIAKAVDNSPATSGTMANSPTLSALGTEVGLIMGTAAYMSPEQAKGFPADHRSDIFSFGVVLFEMLIGRNPFQGDTVSDVLASVLIREVDLGGLPTTLNPRLPDLIRRCLEKAPKKRWQAMGDVRAEIEIIAATPYLVPVTAAAPLPSPVPAPLWKGAWAAAGLALVASAITGALVWATVRPVRAPVPVARFAVTLDAGQEFIGATRAVAIISPDGKRIAYSAGPPFGLYVRNVGEWQARRVEGSDVGAAAPIGPVFSPDGQSLLFWTNADQTLKKIPVDGGAPITVCRTDQAAGVSWGPDSIVYANTEGIFRVSPDGGQPELLVKAHPDETVFGPLLLPGGRVLFTVAPLSGGAEKWDSAHIVVQTLGTGERITIVTGGTDGRYIASGHLVFVRSGILFAAPFDLGKLALSSAPVSMVEGVKRGSGTIGAATGDFSVSDTGTLVYVAGPISAASTTRYLGLFDRDGVAQMLDVPPGPYMEPRMSADGRHIAYGVDDGRDADIWIYDMGSGKAARRLTFGGHNRVATWSADSRRVLFQSDREGDLGIFWQPADGTGVPERLTKAPKDTAHRPLSWQPGGNRFLFESTTGNVSTLWVYSMQERKAERFGTFESSQLPEAVFSPDGHWVAYAVREQGRSNMVYVEPFPRTGAKYQVSSTSEDGHHPIWAPDGSELFYTPGPGPRLTGVPIATKPTFSLGAPATIQRPFTNAASTAGRTYDVAPDGKHFVGFTDFPQNNGKAVASTAELRVVLNWFEELRARARGK